MPGRCAFHAKHEKKAEAPADSTCPNWANVGLRENSEGLDVGCDRSCSQRRRNWAVHEVRCVALGKVCANLPLWAVLGTPGRALPWGGPERLDGRVRQCSRQSRNWSGGRGGACLDFPLSDPFQACLSPSSDPFRARAPDKQTAHGPPSSRGANPGAKPLKCTTAAPYIQRPKFAHHGPTDRPTDRHTDGRTPKRCLEVRANGTCLQPGERH